MCGAQVVVVVREARARDGAARAAVLRGSLAGADRLAPAFLFFFFQETTLQGLVLAGAVLFIFCGVSAPACLLALPCAAAGAVALAVTLHHHLAADKLVQEMSKELFGFVAEARGPLALLERAGGGAPGAVRVVAEHEAPPDWGEPCHTQVVGTVSVSRARGGGPEAWVRGACVAAAWRRRGTGRALAGAARRGAARAGLAGLHALATHLQPEARSMLHHLGWECRGQYERAVCGGAASLPTAHLYAALPYA